MAVNLKGRSFLTLQDFTPGDGRPVLSWPAVVNHPRSGSGKRSRANSTSTHDMFHRFVVG